MNILITGATGNIGRVLTSELSKSSHNILCISRNKEEASKILPQNIKIIETSQLSEITKFQPEVVIHLAAYLTSADDWESQNKLLEANIIFGSQLLNTLKNIGNIKVFINFGTFAEYLYTPSNIDNAYLYSATKSAFKEILRFYSDKFKFPYINIIPYTIYGGEDKSRKILDYLIESIISTTPIKMSPGNQILDFIHVNDVVSFIIYIINNLKFTLSQKYNVYHLGTGTGHSLREISEIIENFAHKPCNIKWGALPYRERDVMYAVAPIGNLLALGWSPKIKIQTYLEAKVKDIIRMNYAK